MSERFVWQAGDVLLFDSQCDVCRHRGEGETCAAFPKGIPDVILGNEHDHREPYEGDHGIQFEATESEANPNG